MGHMGVNPKKNDFCPDCLGKTGLEFSQLSEKVRWRFKWGSKKAKIVKKPAGQETYENPKTVVCSDCNKRFNLETK